MKVLNLRNPFGAKVYHEETVSSTFDIARHLADKNEGHGTVITADFQEAGRGRLNRSWIAKRSESLLFTILLRYENYASVPEALTLRTGLAVSLAIEELSTSPRGEVSSAPLMSLPVKIKWPNDVMINSRKAAGILTEADGKNVYIGVGVNFAQSDFPEEHRSKAVSIAQVLPGLPEDARFLLLENILDRLYCEIETQSASLHWRDRVLKRLYKNGEIVTFADGAADSVSLITGVLSGLGPGGELLIIPDGEKTERAFVTGELRVYK